MNIRDWWPFRKRKQGSGAQAPDPFPVPPDWSNPPADLESKPNFWEWLLGDGTGGDHSNAVHGGSDHSGDAGGHGGDAGGHGGDAGGHGDGGGGGH